VLWAHLNGHLLWANERLSLLVPSRYSLMGAGSSAVSGSDDARRLRVLRAVPASLLLLLLPLLAWHGSIVTHRSVVPSLLRALVIASCDIRIV